MNNYLTRLADRALGQAAAVQPISTPMFAPLDVSGATLEQMDTVVPAPALAHPSPRPIHSPAARPPSIATTAPAVQAQLDASASATPARIGPHAALAEPIPTAPLSSESPSFRKHGDILRRRDETQGCPPGTPILLQAKTDALLDSPHPSEGPLNKSVHPEQREAESKDAASRNSRFDRLSAHGFDDRIEALKDTPPSDSPRFVDSPLTGNDRAGSDLSGSQLSTVSEESAERTSTVAEETRHLRVERTSVPILREVWRAEPPAPLRVASSKAKADDPVDSPHPTANAQSLSAGEESAAAGAVMVGVLLPSTGDRFAALKETHPSASLRFVDSPPMGNDRAGSESSRAQFSAASDRAAEALIKSQSHLESDVQDQATAAGLSSHSVATASRALDATPRQAPPRIEEAQAPIVQVRIGRVEVRGSKPQPAVAAPPSVSPPRTPKLSLNDYLNKLQRDR